MEQSQHTVHTAALKRGKCLVDCRVGGCDFLWGGLVDSRVHDHTEEWMLGLSIPSDGAWCWQISGGHKCAYRCAGCVQVL